MCSLLFSLVFGVFSGPIVRVRAEEPEYTLNAEAVEGLTGVYRVSVRIGADQESATIGLPSVSRLALNDRPTGESPAIVAGVRVQEAEELSIRQSLLGLDGSYYVLRIDLAELLEGVEDPDGKYLHVRQEGNPALTAASGFAGTSFTDGFGNQTASFALANGFQALNDPGDESIAPHLEILLSSSGVPSSSGTTADFTLSFYIDGTEDYFPELTPDSDSVESDHDAEFLKKYFSDEQCTAENRGTGYTVKGSDLEINACISAEGDPGTSALFWSLDKALASPSFASHTIKLIAETPVYEALRMEGEESSARKVTLDLNGFDLRMRNQAESASAALVISKSAELTLADRSGKGKATISVSNASTLVIDRGGTLVLDGSLITEVHHSFFGSGGNPLPESDLFEGEILVRAGGTLINHGVIALDGPSLGPASIYSSAITEDRGGILLVESGGRLENHGCLSVRGTVYALGAINNYGQYAETVTIETPGQEPVTYHNGIQITWADSAAPNPGAVKVGIDPSGTVFEKAALTNFGDIVIAPGELELYGDYINLDGGHLYLCDVTEAIAITYNPEDPEPVTKAKALLSSPRYGLLNVRNLGGIEPEDPNILGATLELYDDGSMGELTPYGQAKGIVSLVRSDDLVIRAVDDSGRVLQSGTDFILKKNGIVFKIPYLETFPGSRTATLNIGYRFYTFQAKGQWRPSESTEAELPSETEASSETEAASVQTSDPGSSDSPDEPADNTWVWFVIGGILAGIVFLIAIVRISKKKDQTEA